MSPGAAEEREIHEAGIAQNVLTIVEDAAKKNGLTSISRVVLEIGPFSGVDSGALQFAFDVLKRGTLLDGAQFEYLTPPLVLHCQKCQAEFVGDPQDMTCPTCEGAETRVLRGRELLVKSIMGA